MSRTFLFLMAVFFSTGLLAQKTKKTKNFSMEMTITAGMTGTKYVYTIDKKGNGLYVRTIRDTVKSEIKFKLDKRQMAELQETVVNKAGVYAIPDKVNCDYCADGIDITIRVFSNKGTKTITGNNPQRVNEDVNAIYKHVKSLVKEKRTD